MVPVDLVVVFLDMLVVVEEFDRLRFLLEQVPFGSGKLEEYSWILFSNPPSELEVR